MLDEVAGRAPRRCVYFIKPLLFLAFAFYPALTCTFTPITTLHNTEQEDGRCLVPDG